MPIMITDRMVGDGLRMLVCQRILAHFLRPANFLMQTPPASLARPASLAS